jgi:hypothetical protein
MGSGRTLRKHSHTRPIKTPGEKLRRNKVQRARLVKFGMDVAVVAKMQPEDVRVLVQRPLTVKKALAAKAVKAAAVADGTAAEPTKKTPKTPKAAKAAAPAKVAKAPKTPKAAKAAKTAE